MEFKCWVQIVLFFFWGDSCHAFLLPFVNTYSCLSCYGVGTLQDCTKHQSCDENQEICVVRTLDDGGFLKFYGGCVRNSDCNHDDLTSHNPHQGTNQICGKCCHGDNCNRDLCEYTRHNGHSWNRYSCLTCNDADSLSDCTATEECLPDEKCSMVIYEDKSGSHHVFAGCETDRICRDGTQVNHYSDYGQNLCRKCCDGDQCNANICGKVTRMGCAVCAGSKCGVTPVSDPVVTCPSSSPLCMTTVHNENSGRRTISKKCASEIECNSKWWMNTICIGFHPTSNYSFPFTCSYCCTTPGCNSHLYPDMSQLYTGSTSVTTSKPPQPSPPPPTTPPTTTTTTSPSTAKSIECELCDGGLCGLIPGNDPRQTCPSSKPYCMNTVQNEDSGQKIYTKQCATFRDCQTKWWEESSDETKCSEFSTLTPYFFQFTCSYCCVTSGCNSDIFPAVKTLFQGKS